MRVRVFGVLCGAFLGLAACGPRNAADPPDAVFFNGKVVTVDSDFSIREAFAVKGETFIAIGTSDEMRALAGEGTMLVDLKGSTVIPGLGDNHAHVYDSAKVTQRGLSMAGVTTLAEALDRIRQAVAAAAPGEVVFTSVLRVQPGPTRQDLDAISTTVPIVVLRGRRGNAQLNIAALTRAGITRASESYAGVAVPKDETGEPSGGTLRYPASMVLLDSLLPRMSEQEEEELLIEAQRVRHSMGLTSVRELSLFPGAMRAFYRLWRKGQLTLRVSMALDLPDTAHIDDAIAAWGVGPEFGDARLRLDSISEDPYPPLVDAETFKRAALAANRHGWRMAPHVEGDESMEAALAAYEAADRESPIKDERWVIEHSVYATPEQMDRMKALGVVVSAQYSAYNGVQPAAVAAVGEERARRAIPVRTLLDHGLIVSTGSDYIGATAIDNPFIPIYFYVTRKTRAGEVIGPEEKISREEALRVSTVNYAYTTFEEDIKGAIEPGKLADFLILSGDILTVPEEEILNLHPLATYVGGTKVFALEGGGF